MVNVNPENLDLSDDETSDSKNETTAENLSDEKSDSDNKTNKSEKASEPTKNEKENKDEFFVISMMQLILRNQKIKRLTIFLMISKVLKNKNV